MNFFIPNQFLIWHHVEASKERNFQIFETDKINDYLSIDRVNSSEANTMITPEVSRIVLGPNYYF